LKRVLQATEGSEASSVFKEDIPATAITILDHVVRFAHNPVSAALAASLACDSLADEPCLVGKAQRDQLCRKAKQYREKAYDLVDYISDAQLTSALLPLSRHNLLQGEHDASSCAIELALQCHDDRFTNHPRCESVVQDTWMKTFNCTLGKLKMPSAASFLETDKHDGFVAIMTANVGELCDVDFLLCPIFRFGTGFALMLWLIALHHVVVFQWGGELDSTRFSEPELNFIIVAIGFLFGEIEQAVEASRSGQAGKYWSDM
jgi:hypothetical protein